jgi:cytoskeletal protein RodZ
VNLLNEAQARQLKEISTHLRQVRQEKSISIEEIAAQTLIRLAFLQALDECEFAELPESVYVQGFIHRYADALGLDGATIANSWIVDFSSSYSQNDSNHLNLKIGIQIPLVIAYILLLLAASSGLFWLLHPRQKQELWIQSQSKKEILPSRSLSSKQNISTVQVTLELQGRSQLQVKADGKTKFKGILTKGERKSWTATKELKISSGNAGAVLVSVNQQQLKPLGGEGEIKEVTYTPAINLP